MIDQKIDEQLNRLNRAIADTSPEPPAISPRSAGGWRPRPIGALVGGFALTLLVGLAAVLVGTQLIGGSNEPSPPAASDDQSRWDWIVKHSEPMTNQGVRVADPSATPAPMFDYTDLGVEQHLTSGNPAVLSFNPLVDGTPQLPLVFVGTVASAENDGPRSSVYLFRTYNEPRAQILTCVSVVSSNGAGTACGLPDEDADPNRIISGFETTSEENRPGISPPDLIVNLAWLPTNTALVVLGLDDGRTFVQRPIIGVAVIEVQDLDDAGIEYAEALDASGRVIVHEDFLWEAFQTAP